MANRNKPTRPHQPRSAGFTLIELLVTIAIISILASLLLPGLARTRNLALRSACLSNLHQIGISTTLYLDDYSNRMPWVPDELLQLTPPVNAEDKRYNAMGAFMPLLAPYLDTPRAWLSPPVKNIKPTDWRRHFFGPWQEFATPSPENGEANYISDKLAERNTDQPRYLRNRSPESLAVRRNSSPSEEEWLMSPFFERGWWQNHREDWRIQQSEPPPTGWSAHNRGRNQLYLDMRAQWIKKDIAQ
ncbi:MAG: type II secretion system protein [Limisphaerales bacterium]|jgi:prepilin-type N-terminal cleavage/methylation domain-containing protein